MKYTKKASILPTTEYKEVSINPNCKNKQDQVAKYL